MKIQGSPHVWRGDSLTHILHGFQKEGNMSKNGKLGSLLLGGEPSFVLVLRLVVQALVVAVGHDLSAG